MLSLDLIHSFLFFRLNALQMIVDDSNITLTMVNAVIACALMMRHKVLGTHTPFLLDA